MKNNFTDEAYEQMLSELFVRYPSFQNSGSSAYKPGIERMVFFDKLNGCPHQKYKSIHIAGTNGKGSTSNMLASVLSAMGFRVGLYTSPHILDFRERMKVIVPEQSEDVNSSLFPSKEISHIRLHSAAVASHSAADASHSAADASHSAADASHSAAVTAASPSPEAWVKKAAEFQLSVGTHAKMISKEAVWDFVEKWKESFEHLSLSFFEITTAMAMDWFAQENVDYAIIETGLGGRLDSTNIISPILSIITNIGLDHCDLLGETLGEIAFEKAGIIKPLTPVVIGESHEETREIFERKVLYSNMPEVAFMGDRKQIMALLTFADESIPSLWNEHESILSKMDLQGKYQKHNLRTVLTALDKLGINSRDNTAAEYETIIKNGLIHTASRTGFHGRWEKLNDNPLIICDIGHNEHGLKINFEQLNDMINDGCCTSLIIVYGSVADKDVDSVLQLFPQTATHIFTQAQSKRALNAEVIAAKYRKYLMQDDCRIPNCEEPQDSGNLKNDARMQNGCKYMLSSDLNSNYHITNNVKEAIDKALELSKDTETRGNRPLIYIGGSTYVVAEAIEALEKSSH